MLVGIILLNAIGIFAQDQCTSFGWANCDGQNYVGLPEGGGTSAPIEVSTFAELKSAAESSEPKVIHILNSVGNGYKGTSGDVLNVKSNKTIIGYPNVTVKCSWQISKVSNIIIRNLTLQGPGNSNSEQNWDVVAINGSKRIWVDHCIVMDGEDGNFDVSKGSDNITASWCIFTYSKDGSHNLSNLIGSSDNEPISHGKLNITYANCWWKNVNSRTPRSRYGKIHILNCYYSNSPGPTCGFMSNMRVEACYFDHIKNPIGLISDGGQAGNFPIDCEFDNCSGNTSALSKGGYTVFLPPYEYLASMVTAKDVKELVTNPDCGAGPTMDSPSACGCSDRPYLGLTSGKSAQIVNVGTPIENIVYTWRGNATGVTVNGLPEGLTAQSNEIEKTITISGNPIASGTYTLTTIQPSETAFSLSATITAVPMIPPTLILKTDNASQSIVIGNSISDIVHIWGGGALDVNVFELADGLTASKNYDTKTITISGTPTNEGTGSYSIETVGGIEPKVLVSGVITAYTIKLKTPTDVTDNATNTRVTIEWNRVDNALGYLLNFCELTDGSGDSSDNCKEYKLTLGSRNRFTKNSLKAGTNYSYQIKAFGVYASEESDFSIIDTIMTTYNTSINTINSSKRVELYPNPTNNSFQIMGIDGQASVMILNLSGELIFKGIVNAHETVQLNSLPQGLFTVKVITEKGVTEKKLLKY